MLKEMKWRSFCRRAVLSHSLVSSVVTGTRDRVLHYRNKLQPAPPLRGIMVETTNHCNLNCIMCGIRQMDRPKGYISRDLFSELMKQVPDNTLRVMHMFTIGEPLLHPELAALMVTAHRKTARLTLSTNAVALRGNYDLAVQIMTSGMNHFHISVDGYNPESYEEVRRGAGFRELLANMALFKKARDCFSPSLAVELQYCLVRPYSLEEFARVFHVFDRYADTIIFKPLNNQAHESIDYRPRERILGMSFFREKPVPCNLLWNSPTILWDGKVSACCRDYDGSFVIGDLSRDSLIDIWHSREYCSLRRDHLSHRFPHRCLMCAELKEDRFAHLVFNKRVRQMLGRPWQEILE